MPEKNNFEQAFTKGKEGRLSNYKTWLSDNYIEQEELTERASLKFFEENPSKLIGRDKELSQLGEYAGYFYAEGGKHHIAVEGVEGAGKTQLLKSLVTLLENVASDLSIYYLNAKEFQKTSEDSTKFENYLSELSRNEDAVLMVDDAGKDKRIKQSLSRLQSATKNIFIISAWEPEMWEKIRNDMEDGLGVSQTFELNPLSSSEIEELISTVVNEVWEAEKKIDERVIYSVNKFSQGVPLLAIRLLIRSTKESFLNDYDIFSPVSIDEAAKSMGLEMMKEKAEKLSGAQKAILSNIVLSIDQRGAQPKEMERRLDRDKSTISYHLRKLKSEKILESEKVGRSVFYRVNSKVKPILQLQLKEENVYG